MNFWIVKLLIALLAIFFHKKIGFDEDLSTALVHYFIFALYFTPLIGTYLADSWIGKYKSMLIMTAFYSIGTIVLTVGTVDSLNLPLKLYQIL
jgi:dipeptide/tripeptide permease